MDVLGILIGAKTVRVAREDRPIPAAEVRVDDLVFVGGEWAAPYFGETCSLDTLPHGARFIYDGALCWRSGTGSNGRIYRLADVALPFGPLAQGSNQHDVRAWHVRPFLYRAYVVENPEEIKPDTVP